MILRITQIEEPIFEEELRYMVPPEGQSSGSLTFVLYQFHSRTFFGESTYNKVNPTFFIKGSNHKIPKQKWTREMTEYAQMRENTIPRIPKKVRYNFFGKALFTLLFVLILVIGFQVFRSISTLKKEKTEEAVLLSDPKENDVYYGNLTEFASNGVLKRTGWTWLKVVKIEGSDYTVSLGKEITEGLKPDSSPSAGFETETYPLKLKKGEQLSFKSADNNFIFSVMKKQ